MPIFLKQLTKVDATNPQKALQDMANHIRYIQEQLEYTLMNLDSSNITEIETDKTNITSSSGGASFNGNSISFKGKGGEVFEAGVGDDGIFRFSVKGKGGIQMLYLTSDGQLVLTKKVNVNVDGGEW